MDSHPPDPDCEIINTYSKNFFPLKKREVAYFTSS